MGVLGRRFPPIFAVLARAAQQRGLKCRLAPAFDAEAFSFDSDKIF